MERGSCCLALVGPILNDDPDVLLGEGAAAQLNTSTPVTSVQKLPDVGMLVYVCTGITTYPLEATIRL